MRGLRSFAVLLAFLIGLGAYLYFVESKRTPGAGEDERDRVFTVDSEAIDEMTVQDESGERTTVRRSGDDWQMTEPVAAPADPAEISGLTSDLASLEVQRVIDEEAADLAEYGLAEPRIQVSFRAGDQTRRLSIGGKTPPGSDVYARVDDERRVILIAAYLESTFNRGAFDLRDKAVTRLDREAIDTLDITAGSRATRLVRADGEWRLTQPIAAPADYGEVNGLISRLTSAQMRTIEDAPDADLKAYGLDRPAAIVRAGSGDAPLALRLGGPAEAGAVYAKHDTRPGIFTVDDSLLEALTQDPSEYRQKDLFDARAFNTTRIEVTRAGRTVAFEKTRGKDADGKELETWRQVAPADAEVDGAKVDALIFAATGARAESFVTDARQQTPATPEIAVVIRFDDGVREDRVGFWRVGSDAFAARADAPGIARVDPATLDDIVAALGELP